jgi:hypothetical protein
MGAELFHADRQTDGQAYLKKAIEVLRNFAKAPKNNENNTFAFSSVFFSFVKEIMLVHISYNIHINTFFMESILLREFVFWIKIFM